MTQHTFTSKLFSKKEVELIGHMVDTGYDNSFTEKFQARSYKKDGEYYTLATLLQAVDDTQHQFAQFPIDDKNVKALAKDIFITNEWMKKDVVVVYYDDKLYLSAGRHRLSAIRQTFEQLAYITGTSYDERVDYYEALLGQNIRVEVYYVESYEDLLEMVIADNQSRSIRKAEAVHLSSQLNGADADTPESCVATAYNYIDTDPKKARDVAAGWFARQIHSSMTTLTRQLVGEKFAQHVLYGEQKLTKKAKTAIGIDECIANFEQLWYECQLAVNGDKVLARNVKGIYEKTLARIQRTDVVATDDDGDF